ncbi:Histone deacetylase HDT1 [Linum perenne]
MTRSLFLELFPLKRFLSCNLTWYLIETSSCLIMAKMGVYTSLVTKFLKLNTSEEPDSDGEDFPAAALNGAPFSHASEIKPAKEEKEKPSSSGTKKVKIVEPIKDDSSDEESDDSSDEDDDLSDDDDQTDNDKGKLIKAAGTSDDDDDDDEDEDSDEEETDEEDVIEKKAKKDSTSKKRSDPETTTPVPNKKAKMVTPQKTGVKKASEHKATPHPAKQATKTSASGDPKLHVCKSCNRSFGTDFALESHSKAKHGDGK